VGCKSSVPTFVETSDVHCPSSDVHRSGVGA
jgi:hypothetical protein